MNDRIEERILALMAERPKREPELWKRLGDTLPKALREALVRLQVAGKIRYIPEISGWEVT